MVSMRPTWWKLTAPFEGSTAFMIWKLSQHFLSSHVSSNTDIDLLWTRPCWPLKWFYSIWWLQVYFFHGAVLDWSSFNLVYSKKLRQVWIAGSVLDSQKDTHFFYFFTQFLGKFWFVSKPMSEKHSFIIKFLPEKCAGLCYVGIHNLVWLRPLPWGLDGLWAQPWQMYHTPSVMLNLKKEGRS